MDIEQSKLKKVELMDIEQSGLKKTKSEEEDSELKANTIEERLRDASLNIEQKVLLKTLLLSNSSSFKGCLDEFLKLQEALKEKDERVKNLEIQKVNTGALAKTESLQITIDQLQSEKISNEEKIE